jgi:hypothetical protein
LSGEGSVTFNVKSERTEDEKTIELEETEDPGIFYGNFKIDNNEESQPDILVDEVDRLIINQPGMEISKIVGVDCVDPLIGDVCARNEKNRTLISWTTNEDTNCELFYSVPEQSFSENVKEDSFNKEHLITLENLEFCEYQFMILAEDKSGNISSDDNNGSMYNFFTNKKIVIRFGPLTGNGLWQFITDQEDYPYDFWFSGYEFNQCDRLNTPYFYISPEDSTYLSFRTSYNVCEKYDAGRVYLYYEGSNDWAGLEPEGWYPDSTDGGSKSCIGPRYTCFSGFNDAWDKFTFPLSLYMGQNIVLSFLFGTDNKEAGEGWYIAEMEVWRYIQCMELENNFNAPIVKCKMNDDTFQTDDYLEGILVYNNPLDEDVPVDVYSAILSDGKILFWIAEGASEEITFYSKILPAQSTTYESIFTVPLLNENINGEFTLATAITKKDTTDIYGEVSFFTFRIN